MGRQPITPAEHLGRARSNGYKPGEHKQQDEVRGCNKHGTKTKKEHDKILNRYVYWRLGIEEERCVESGLSPPGEAAIRERYLGPKADAPDLVTIKDFLRYLAAGSSGVIHKEKKITVDTLKAYAEYFHAGFARVTGTEIDIADRSEVYFWIQRTLVPEGVVVPLHRAKHNFVKEDLNCILRALWSLDDLIFIPERYRIQFTFIIRVYCWTGARVSTFFAAGFKYGDIDLVLKRHKTDGWRLMYQIRQSWVKNNLYPEDVYFGAACGQQEEFIYNDAAFLLTMAIEDGALFGYETLDDLRQQQIPEGTDTLILKYNKSAEDQYILRKCTKAHGVTNEPMPMSAFLSIYRQTLQNSGYSCSTSLHMIRRGLGQNIDERYTPVQRAQHMLHADLKIFGDSYVASCSRVEGAETYLGKKKKDIDHSPVEFFQGLGKFHERGLPCQLPAHLEEALTHDPRLCELESEMQALRLKREVGTPFKEARSRRAGHLKSLKRTALRQYQEEWIEKRRDWFIVTRGKEVPDDLCRTDLFENLCLLIPERGRLARLMASDKPLPPAATWQAMQDLQSLCSRDVSVLYLPGHEPVEGSCPTEACQLKLNSLPKTRRNRHVHDCIRTEMAVRLGRPSSEIYYCYHCFDWIVADQWETHCQPHLQKIASKRCGTITHIHTLLRPGYCPFCLGDEALAVSKRMQSWTRDAQLWGHLNEHLADCRWPARCPHPLCDVVLEDERKLQYHFMDIHRISRTRPVKSPQRLSQQGVPESPTSNAQVKAKPNRSRKRKLSTDGSILEWMPAAYLPTTSIVTERSIQMYVPKKAREETRTICPALLFKAEGTGESQPDFRTPIASPTCSTVEMDFTHSDVGLEIVPLDPASIDVDVSGEALFSQYLRSPSLSPSATEVPSDYSGETAIATTDGSDLSYRSRQVQRSSPQGLEQENTDGVEKAPSIRIRLRVNRPKPRIVLRFSGLKTSTPPRKRTTQTGKSNHTGKRRT